MIVLGLIIAFIIGLLIGAGIICCTKAADKTDIQIMFLQVMDQLKKDKKEADKYINLNVEKDINYGIYHQANKTMDLIKKLYGGIC